MSGQPRRAGASTSSTTPAARRDACHQRQSWMVVTRVGDLDVSIVTQHMQKPASAVVMTFAADPCRYGHRQLTGSAVVFQATVTFTGHSRRTARP